MKSRNVNQLLHRMNAFVSSMKMSDSVSFVDRERLIIVLWNRWWLHAIRYISQHQPQNCSQYHHNFVRTGRRHQLQRGGPTCQIFTDQMLIAMSQDCSMKMKKQESAAKVFPFFKHYKECSRCSQKAVKQQLDDPEVQQNLNDRDSAAAQGRTLHQVRLSILQTIVQREIPVITPHKCRHEYEHSTSYLSRCIQRIDIIFIICFSFSVTSIQERSFKKTFQFLDL